MSNLRLIILLIGIVFIIAVGLFTHRSERIKREREKERAPRQRPDTQDFPEIHVSEGRGEGEESVPHAPSALAETAAEMPETEQRAPRARHDASKHLIISLYVVANRGREFPGAATQAALENAGLRFGRHNIFHRMAETDADKPLFSVAKISEPGSFERDRLIDTSVRGLTFFMLLPGPCEGLEAFSKLLGAARQVTSALGGKLQDELHGSLTRQRIQQMREQIIEFQAYTRGARATATSQRREH